jgi:hypothetical protein
MRRWLTIVTMAAGLTLVAPGAGRARGIID